MIFETPYFVADYRSTSWVPTGRAAELAPAAEPIYQDDEFAAFDQPVEGATVYGYVWPAKYYRMKSPRQRHRDAPATE